MKKTMSELRGCIEQFWEKMSKLQDVILQLREKSELRIYILQFRLFFPHNFSELNITSNWEFISHNSVEKSKFWRTHNCEKSQNGHFFSLQFWENSQFGLTKNCEMWICNSEKKYCIVRLKTRNFLFWWSISSLFPYNTVVCSSLFRRKSIKLKCNTSLMLFTAIQFRFSDKFTSVCLLDTCLIEFRSRVAMFSWHLKSNYFDLFWLETSLGKEW